MDKNILHSAIRKVFLDLTDVEHFIFWDSEHNKLNLKSLDVAHNTTVMSTVTMNHDSRAATSVVIKDPDILLKALEISDQNVDIIIRQNDSVNTIVVKDSTFESEIVVVDINYIAQNVLEKKNTEPEEPISYDVIIDINSDFIEKFSKARKVNKSEVVSIWTKDRNSVFQLGDANNFTNKVKFSVEMAGIFDMDKLLFSSAILQSIFDRNRKSQGKIWVDPTGLMKLTFVEEINGFNLNSTYFVVAQDTL